MTGDAKGMISRRDLFGKGSGYGMARGIVRSYAKGFI